MRSSTIPLTSVWLRDVSAGVVAGAVCVAYAISYAALLFPGVFSDLLPAGLALTLISATLGAFWLAWRSQLPFAIAGPDGNTTSIVATMAATLPVAGSAFLGEAALANVLAMVGLTTLLCAVLFLALGLGRMGRAVRYVPYPVIGGFLASTGWLVATGALRVAADGAGTGGHAHLLATALDPRVAASVGLGLVFLLLFRRYRHPALIPIVLVLSAAATLAVLALAGLPPEQARGAGWLFTSAAPALWVPPWQLADMGALDWQWLLAQWPEMLAVAAVAVITVLLGASGLEVMSRADISLDRELRTHGWLNLAAALLGGYLSLVSVGRSAVLLENRAASRAAGVVAAVVCAAAALGASSVLGWIPKPVLAGFLLSLGLAILWEWVVAARKRVGRADWWLIIVILLTTATIGFTVAVLAGIIASCLNFALSYSRVGVVQHELDGRTIHSAVVRPAAHRQVLDQTGADIRVLVLRGVIFFGTANTLLERVRPFLEQPRTGARVLVLDFSHVASTDSSAEMTFTKIAQLAVASGARLMVCGVSAAAGAALGHADAMPAGTIHATLDQALDAAEETLLRAHGLNPSGVQESLDQWLPRELEGQHHWKLLAPLLRRREVAAGEVLLEQGERSDATLYLIESGQLSVTLRGQQAGRRLASLMAGNIVGEMALYSNADRSATVRADRDAVVWALTRSALEGLQADAPETALQVHAMVMHTVSERVRLANATIAALQRGA